MENGTFCRQRLIMFPSPCPTSSQFLTSSPSFEDSAHSIARSLVNGHHSALKDRMEALFLEVSEDEHTRLLAMGLKRQGGVGNVGFGNRQEIKRHSPQKLCPRILPQTFRRVPTDWSKSVCDISTDNEKGVAPCALISLHSPYATGPNTRDGRGSRRDHVREHL